VVLAQRAFTKDRGWPVPSKFADLYDNLLGNCPYQAFFDAESLCHSDNEANVSKLLGLQGQQAADFFNVTFRGNGRNKLGNYIIKLCCRQTFAKKRELFKISSRLPYSSHNKRFYKIIQAKHSNHRPHPKV
jgi:hypothetical protein